MGAKRPKSLVKYIINLGKPPQKNCSFIKHFILIQLVYQMTIDIDSEILIYVFISQFKRSRVISIYVTSFCHYTGQYVLTGNFTNFSLFEN